MAYIAPSSTVHLLANVPIEPTFENSVWYNSRAEQEADFLNYRVVTLNNQSYIHKDRGVIRVETPISTIISCNYMMFKNTLFENKWFYAFINRVEYVSNDVTDVFFSIDPLQTWLLDFTLDPSFIAREIPYDDIPQFWLIPESVDSGPLFIYDQQDWLNDATDLTYIMCAPFTVTYDEDEGTYGVYNYGGILMAGGIPSGNLYTRFTTLASLVSALQFLNTTNTVHYPDGSTATKANLISEVVSIFLAPATLFSHTETPYAVRWDTYLPIEREQIPVNAQVGGDGAFVNPYNIRNKKLTAYPYMYYMVTDYNGNTAIYKPELFAHSDANQWVSFQVTGDTAPNGGLIAFPRYYKGYNGEGAMGLVCKTEGTQMRGFPTISWTPDVWKSWLASTGIENAVNTVKDLLSGNANTVSNILSDITTFTPQQTENKDVYSNPKEYWTQFGDMIRNSFRKNAESDADKLLKIGGAATVMLGVVHNMSQYYQQSLKPNTVLGAQSGGAKIANNMINLSAFQCGIGIERASELDSFFDSYGYAVNRFGVPYMFGNYPHRPVREYFQTVGANVGGLLPKDSADALTRIFDSGIRFWRGFGSGETTSALHNVNRYDYDNSPTI